MLLVVAAAYAFALLAPLHFGPLGAAIAMAIGLFFISFGASLRARLWFVPIMLAAALAGLSKPPPEQTIEPPDGLYRIEAEVLSVRHGERGPSVEIEIVYGEEISGKGVYYGKARLFELELIPGTHFLGVAELKPPRTYINPRIPFELERWPPPPPGGRLVNAPELVREASSAQRALYTVRRAIRNALIESLEPRASGLARSLVLGESGALDESTRDTLRSAGLAHILAVSGLHVGIAAGLFYALFSLLFYRTNYFLDKRRVIAALSLPAVLIFAEIAGGAPSAKRAGFMLALALACRALGRRPSALRTLGAALFLFGILTPDELSRPGLHLSILATLSILTMPRPKAGPLSALATAWQLSYRTTIATAPLVLVYFESLPVLGVIANLILLPIASVALIPLALLHTALALAGGGALSAGLFEATAAAIVAGSGVFGGEHLELMPPPPNLPQLIAVGLIAIFLLFRIPWKRRALLLMVPCLFYLSAELHLRAALRREPTVTVLDIGQGSAASLELPSGELLLFDAAMNEPDLGERVVRPYLRKRRHRSIDLFIGSHSHPDHVGGLESVDAALPIKELWAPKPPNASDAFGQFRLSRAFKERVSSVEGCEERMIGGARIVPLSPCPGDPLFDDENEDSLVVRVEIGGVSILIPGDIEARREKLLAETKPHALRADILIAAHHGSRTSSTEEFLSAVRPELVIISAGRPSPFGHPHPEVVERIKAHGARALTTPEDGGIAIRFSQDGYAISAARERTEEAASTQDEQAFSARGHQPARTKGLNVAR